MLIRSQDKDKIINLQNIGSISIRFVSENGYAIDTTFPGKTGETIAYYFTKEKAIKVLDIIQETYIAEFEELREGVFQMPQYSEVEA